MNTASNHLLVAAFGYATRGWKVLPCKPKGKTPATKHGFKDATIDKAKLISEWKTKPTANVAIATGAESGIVVLDVDPRNGGDDSLRELERVHGPLPETLTVATGGGGRHFYFASPPTGIKSGKLADGLDVKADAGYIIAPPSVHPSGEIYRWTNEPGKTPLAQCPSWIRVPDRTKHREKPQGSARNLDSRTTILGRHFEALGMLGRLLDGGKRAVQCPWQEGHTTGALQDMSTVIFLSNEPGGLGGFHCFHSHCLARTVPEVLRALERRIAAGDVERAWTAKLRRGQKGVLRASFGNLVTILTHDSP